MPISNKQGFERVDIALSPFIKDPQISEDIAQTLTRLLAWNSTKDQFELVQLDSQGSLRFSQAPAPVGVGSYSQATITTTVGLVLAANADRRYFSVFNNGGVAVYVGFDTSVTTSTGFVIPIGGAIGYSFYYGSIFGIVSTGSCDLRIIEH